MKQTPTQDQAAGLRSALGTRRGWSLAVTSGKGGVGKTSVAVNLALAYALAGTRTCLLDGDLGLANVDVLLNIHPAYSLRDVVAGTKELEEVAVPGPAGLQVLPAASGVEALANLTGPAQRTLLERFRGLAELAEVTVLDTGAGISRTVLSLTSAADEVLLLTTPEPTALTDAYAMVKLITQRRPEVPLHLVVNLVDSTDQAQAVHTTLDRITRRFLHRVVPLAGWIPRDACVERAVREQRPLALYFPYARATEAIQRLARGFARGRSYQRGDAFWERLMAGTQQW
jgi:flagellar biosynthesis protein FlhG